MTCTGAEEEDADDATDVETGEAVPVRFRTT